MTRLFTTVGRLFAAFIFELDHHQYSRPGMVEAYLLNDMRPALRHEFELHCQACAECGNALEMRLGSGVRIVGKEMEGKA
jgi:hypothetical protein